MMRLLALTLFLSIAAAAGAQDCKGLREHGWELVVTSQYDRALDAFSRAMACDDGFAYAALYGHAFTLYKMNDLKQAEKELLMLVKLKPKFNDQAWFANVHGTLARVYARRSTKKEMQQYRLALKCDPTDVAILQTMGYALNREGKYKEALMYLNRAIEIDGGFAYAYSNRAHALAMLGDTAAALVDLRKSEALDNTNPYLYKHWGLYYLRRNEKEKACAMFHLAREKGYKEFGMEADRHDVDNLMRRHCGN